MLGRDDGSNILDVLPEVSPVGAGPELSPVDGAGSCRCGRSERGKGDRTCRAVFVTDDGAVRPDLADRTWGALLTAPEVEVSDPLDEAGWRQLWETGHGYAIRPEQITEPGSPPGLILRLLVRVRQ